MKYHVSFDIEFRKNQHEGIYIALEGIDGSGKTTQSQRLKDYFEKKGKNVVLTKEPTKKPPIGTLIHSFLLRKVKLPRVSLQYLFASDRAIHMEKFVEPSLQKGKVVISDRCFWSSVAYGILDKMENSGKLDGGDLILASQSILSMYHQFIVPDVTFYIKVSAQTAVSRLSKMGKKKEYYETLQKLRKVKSGYDWLAKKFPNEIVIIDGEQTEDEVFREIIKHVNNF